jgi:hypothetical protein
MRQEIAEKQDEISATNANEHVDHVEGSAERRRDLPYRLK